MKAGRCTALALALLAAGLHEGARGGAIEEHRSQGSRIAAPALGPGESVLIPGGPDRHRHRDVLQHHDGSFEDAFCFQMSGVVPPFYGAFAEAFPARSEMTFIDEALLWVTQVGAWSGQPLDLYLWDGGVSGPPGEVRHHLTGLGLETVPQWPEVAENGLMMAVPLPEGDFSIGYWADFSTSACGWYVAADRDGPGGYPWVNIAPGIGFPTGWNHPEVLWPPPVAALGIGASLVVKDLSVEESDPAAHPPTWGRIKALYHW